MMRGSSAALGSAVLFVVVPGTVVGLVPWLITPWEVRRPSPYRVVAEIVGVVMICGGLVPVMSAFVEFVKAGGTPAPIAYEEPTLARRYGAEYDAYRRGARLVASAAAMDPERARLSLVRPHVAMRSGKRARSLPPADVFGSAGGLPGHRRWVDTRPRSRQMIAALSTAALSALIPLLVLIVPLLLDSLEKKLLAVPPDLDDAGAD